MNQELDLKTSLTEKIKLQFKKFSENGVVSEPNWLKEYRNLGCTNFEKLGFPTQSDEEWKYTNISPVIKSEFNLTGLKSDSINLSKSDFSKYIISNSYTFVFVNGQFVSSLSVVPNEEGIEVASIKEIIKTNPEILEKYIGKVIELENNSFASLNSTFFTDGIFIQVNESKKLSKPIEILYLSVNENNSPRMTHPRNCIIVKKNGMLDFTEHYVSLNSNKNLTNVVTELFLEENTKCNHIKIQNEVNKAFHFGNTAISQKATSEFFTFSFSLGGLISRNQIILNLDGEKSNSNMNGLYISTSNQLHDNHTLINHKTPKCNSRELYKGILYDESKSVFNGKVYVHSIAQKTDSKQTNKNLLLSENATIDTKPQLEIFADDVKCTHGGTVGGIDVNSLFYMKSRGISIKSAEALIALGFASEVTETIENLDLRKYVDTLIVDRLEKSYGNISLPIIAHSS